MINDSKELILKKIRNVLKPDDSFKDKVLENVFFEDISTKTKSKLIKQFKEEITKVSGEIIELKKSEDLVGEVVNISEKNNYENFLIWETELFKSLKLEEELESRGLTHNKSRSIKKLAESDIGITEVDFAIADTGTLVLFSENKKPRIPSVLAPVHIAVLKKENILTNIHELFSRIKTQYSDLTEISSCMTFITGPSRTADIELSLTLGVHGPGRLIVFLI